ncbi:MAG TPA: GxxExxY protein [Novosphingobium sp.]|nr:GxxExxY protein [Novosphingobium sp.]HNN55880.1 GxxExxY protein [Novosphingobium sp.]
MHGIDARKATKPQKVDAERLEAIAKKVVDCGFRLHRDVGPGLLESVYEVLLCEYLKECGLGFARQLVVPISHRGVIIDNAFRADVLVEGTLLLELKSTEQHSPVHAKQLLTYLRLLDLPLGLLMNFGAASYKEGIHRIGNNYFAPQQIKD